MFNAHEGRGALFFSVVALALVGCGGGGFRSEAVSIEGTKVSLGKAVELDDEAWAKELGKLNESGTDFVKEHGPFRLTDYEKTVSLGTMDGKSALWIMYQYRNAGFLGHPAHFSAYVYLTTGDVQLVAGR